MQNHKLPGIIFLFLFFSFTSLSFSQIKTIKNKTIIQKTKPKLIKKHQLPPFQILKLRPTIQSNTTAHTIFIGYTEITQEGGQSLLNKAKHIRSIAEYEQLFGSYSTNNYYLASAIQLFFTNGGKESTVISVGSYHDFISLGSPTTTGLLKGLEIAKQQVNGNLIVVPDAVSLTQSEQIHFYENVLQHCSQAENRFAILDLKDPEGSSQSVSDFRTNIGTNALAFGAVYSPWLINLEGKSVPPSGAVAGIFARNDEQEGVWKAPANYSVQGIQGLATEYTTTERERLTIDAVGGKSINPIVTFPNRGTLVWGARTLHGYSPEWRYVPVRRFANSIQQSVNDYLFSLKGVENNKALWEKIDKEISTFLYTYYQQGALLGTKPEDAYFVSVGLGSTMTQTEIDKGRLKVLVGIAPIKPAEFIIIPFEIHVTSN